MRVLVTGGSGFLGARLVPALVAEGHEVLALTRSASADEKVRTMGGVPVRGDLEGPESLSLPKIDAVVHAAAHFHFAGPRSPYFRVNVTGTSALLKAAEAAGARTFVYLSAGAIVMDDRGSPIRNGQEDMPVYPKSFSAYIASKAQGEAAVLAANKGGFRTLALRPPIIWGPGDMLSRQLPDAIKHGQFAFIDRGDFPYATCHVDNLIEAVTLALERGTGGRAYFVNDPEGTTFRDFVAGLATLQGLSIDSVGSIPYPFAFTLARLMEFGKSITFSTSDPALSRTMVRMIGREFTTNDADARRDLGYVGKVTRTEGLARYQNEKSRRPLQKI
jgi:nucleoside-diphosphate-sugar epimerase